MWLKRWGMGNAPTLSSSKKPWGQEIPNKGISWLLFYATFSDILAK